MIGTSAKPQGRDGLLVFPVRSWKGTLPGSKLIEAATYCGQLSLMRKAGIEPAEWVRMIERPILERRAQPERRIDDWIPVQLGDTGRMVGKKASKMGSPGIPA